MKVKTQTLRVNIIFLIQSNVIRNNTLLGWPLMKQSLYINIKNINSAFELNFNAFQRIKEFCLR